MVWCGAEDDSFPDGNNSSRSEDTNAAVSVGDITVGGEVRQPILFTEHVVVIVAPGLVFLRECRSLRCLVGCTQKMRASISRAASTAVVAHVGVFLCLDTAVHYCSLCPCLSLLWLQSIFAFRVTFA